jgi:hypothetical protein
MSGGRAVHQSGAGIRDMLFADVPLSSWVPQSSGVMQEPWKTFAQARKAQGGGQKMEAVALLRAVAAMPAVESRHYLEAWHVLRELGVAPPTDLGKRLCGVVVEVALPDGQDLLAAYADHTARYLNWSGAAVVWDAPDAAFNSEIDAVLAAGHRIVERIGPWEALRPPPPPTGQVRLNLLTPSGLHFGQGPMDDLARDALAGPLLAAATKLMQGLTARAKQQRSARA